MVPTASVMNARKPFRVTRKSYPNPLHRPVQSFLLVDEKLKLTGPNLLGPKSQRKRFRIKQFGRLICV